VSGWKEKRRLNKNLKKHWKGQETRIQVALRGREGLAIGVSRGLRRSSAHPEKTGKSRDQGNLWHGGGQEKILQEKTTRRRARSATKNKCARGLRDTRGGGNIDRRREGRAQTGKRVHNTPAAGKTKRTEFEGLRSNQNQTKKKKKNPPPPQTPNSKMRSGDLSRREKDDVGKQA